MFVGARILVVDDDNRLRDLLTKYLQDNSYYVESASDASQAGNMLAKSTYDLIILDVMMPNMTGFEFAAQINDNGNKIPILYLSAMANPDDRIKGLELGAQDYLIKPFEPKELLLRCRTILKNFQPKNAREITMGEYRFKVGRGQLSKDGVEVSITTMEVALLKAMGSNPGQPISRDELAELSGVSLSPRTVDVQITRLRKKIEPDPKNPIYIKTVRHKGYALWPDA